MFMFSVGWLLHERPIKVRYKIIQGRFSRNNSSILLLCLLNGDDDDDVCAELNGNESGKKLVVGFLMLLLGIKLP